MVSIPHSEIRNLSEPEGSLSRRPHSAFEWANFFMDATHPSYCKCMFARPEPLFFQADLKVRG